MRIALGVVHSLGILPIFIRLERFLHVKALCYECLRWILLCSVFNWALRQLLQHVHLNWCRLAANIRKWRLADCIHQVLFISKSLAPRLRIRRVGADAPHVDEARLVFLWHYFLSAGELGSEYL